MFVIICDFSFTATKIKVSGIKMNFCLAKNKFERVAFTLITEKFHYF